MATHDYVIDNQTAPNFRADLNNALSAIVTQNSSATAPATTYANMIWYDTANNQLKKRNEANSGWITLGTIDETSGTFLPNALSSQAQAEGGTDNATLMTPLRVAQAITSDLASQAEAEAGTNNTKLMTPLRVAQAIATLGASNVLLGTITTTSGSTQTLSGLNLTSYKFVVAVIDGVQTSPTSTPVFAGVSTTSTSTGPLRGFIMIDLSDGTSSFNVAIMNDTVGSRSAAGLIANTNVTTASTSISITTSNTFSAGTIRIYGMK